MQNSRQISTPWRIRCWYGWALISAFLALILRFVSIVIESRRSRKRVVGFFHPYTNDGGGGERVLWCTVKATQEDSPGLDCVVFTGDHDASSHSLMARAGDRFGVKLIHPPKTHGLQLHAFSVAIKRLEANLPRPKIQFVGSCRNKADGERLQNLKDQAIELKVEEDVEFHKNLMYMDLV